MKYNGLQIVVYNHKNFDTFCSHNAITDDNVETIFNNCAFISIIGTKNCLECYLNEKSTKHWFKENHSNVLNLEFDDIDEDIKVNGILYKALSAKQSLQLYEFIENNLGKTFFVHCRAGKSRSQAVAKFINELVDKYVIIHKANTVNSGVMKRLHIIRTFISDNNHDALIDLLVKEMHEKISLIEKLKLKFRILCKSLDL